MINYVKPQKGFQHNFLSSSADVLFGGSGAGVGKTWATLAEPLRYAHVKGFEAITFRRTSPQITSGGGLWDASEKIYGQLPENPRAVKGDLYWKFPSGAKLQFRHLEHEKNRLDYQGTEFAFIGWDELPHFTRKQFFYLLSRNRSTCGVKPYVRATMNPEAHGWVKEMVQWYLYEDDYEVETLQGYPIPERIGKLRYFIGDGDDGQLIWGSSKEEVIQKAPHIFLNRELLLSLQEAKIHPYSMIKSFSFIPGTIFDNKKLLVSDPGYLGNLQALPQEEKVKLLGGCWKMLTGEDQLYKYSAIKDLFTNDFVAPASSPRQRYITADVALEGSDLFVVGVWYGWVLKEVRTMPKSNGKQVIDLIKNLAKEHSVPNTNIAYDSDGVGGFVGGFISGAKSFHGNATPVPVRAANGMPEKEQYENLRTQCYYRLAEFIDGYQIYIEDNTFEHRIVEELHATRKQKFNGIKHRILAKSEISTKIKGRSPDFADMIMMRVYLELVSAGRGEETITVF